MDVDDLAAVLGFFDDSDKLFLIVEHDLISLLQHLIVVRKWIFLTNSFKKNFFHFRIKNLSRSGHIIFVKVDLRVFVLHLGDANSLFHKIKNEKEGGHLRGTSCLVR